jgi:adenylylsulfate kinase
LHKNDLKLANIHPIFDKIVNKSRKEQLLKQKAIVIWFVGLSGSGKSTIAVALENELHQRGYLTQLLDGDNLRSGVNNNLGFSAEDRSENIRRTAEVAKLFLNCGVITLCSFISPTEEIRLAAKSIIGTENFFEVYVKCSLEVAEQRDVKGLYAKARKGEIKDFTGITSPFEEPQTPDLLVDTSMETAEESVVKVFDAIIKKVKI